MGDDDKHENKLPGAEGGLAGDVARLYSWANMEEGSYRDFCRKRTLSPPPLPLPYPIAEEISPQRAPDPELPPAAEGGRSALALYSVASGSGKTTLCANLGRFLCSLGEQILLVDASGRGLLPFYFGASEARAGLRTFQSPDPICTSVQVIGAEAPTADWLRNEVGPAMPVAGRTIFDIGSVPPDLLGEILGMSTEMLIPLLPDLNSALTLARIEASLRVMQSSGRRLPPVYYVLNQFEEPGFATRRTRDLVIRNCGDSLLSITIHRGLVEEALGAGMTLADHAPESETTRDFLELALWLRKISPINPQAGPLGGWSER